jgi:hypothetical protein
MGKELGLGRNRPQRSEAATEGAQPLGCSGPERVPDVGPQGQLGRCFGRFCSLKAALLLHRTFPRSPRTIWAIAGQRNVPLVHSLSFLYCNSPRCSQAARNLPNSWRQVLSILNFRSSILGCGFAALCSVAAIFGITFRISLRPDVTPVSCVPTPAT